jgi:hypothetical protein
MSTRAIDLTGQRFGRLTVVARAENNKRGQRQWGCECDCGNHVVILRASLRHGHTRSCGCLKKEKSTQHARSLNLKHDMHGTPTYQSYQSAKRRCQNPNDPSYADYGARGIKFIYASFEDFLDDLGWRPPGTTLERCDNAGHYERGCCRWATPTEQNNNKRNNRLVTAFGRTRTLARWARETGINSQTLRGRLNKGWLPEKALIAPVRPRRRFDVLEPEVRHD